MNIAALHDQPHLSICTPDADVAALRDKLAHVAPVSNRADLEHLFCRLLASVQTNPTPKTLDLIGHAAPGSSLLTLGSWVIDAASPVVASYFRGLADNNVLPRLGIHAVRLLGSLTAVTPAGQATICALSETLGVEVYGARNLLYATHFDAAGFKESCRALLTRSSDLRFDPPSTQPLLVGDYDPHILDLDATPATPSRTLPAAMWPRRFASVSQAGEILRLVRRDAGRTMPALLVTPNCELAVPSASGGYHVMQILLEGEHVRVHAEGSICYPVSAPRSLLALVDGLPQAAAAA